MDKKIQKIINEIEYFKKGCGYETLENDNKVCKAGQLCKRCRSQVRRYNTFLIFYEIGKKEGKEEVFYGEASQKV